MSQVNNAASKLVATSLAFLGLVIQAAAYAELQFNVSTLADGLNSPWSMAQVDEETWIITERDGHVVVVNTNGQSRYQLNLPDLYLAGQGGLLDVLPAPDFSESQRLYITYAHGNGQANRLVVAYFHLYEESVSAVTEVFRVNTSKSTPVHYAGRLALLPDNTLLVTSGDGFDYREQAQVKASHLGKILRINLDGSLPKDNPFFSGNNAGESAVYSLGHRNTQGLVVIEQTGQIFSHEHGPAGGDEFNIIEPGNNYGWPVVTLGKDYSGARISPFENYTGMVDPIINWTPSIAPSGMAYYGPDFEQGFKNLANTFLITTLVDKRLYAIHQNAGEYSVRPIFDAIQGRLRDVKVSADGDVVVLTDGEGASLKLLRPVH